MFHLAHATAFLANGSLAELDQMSPAEMRRFAELCYHWYGMADRRARGVQQPKSGPLAQLAAGERAP